VKKASIYILFIEELTDLMYELNDIYNLQSEVNCKYPEHFLHRLNNIVRYTAEAIELASSFTDNARDAQAMVDWTFSTTSFDGYVDRGDLKYAIEKAHEHTVRMNMAYQYELDPACSALLTVLQLLLTDTDYLLYGDRNNVRLTEESPALQEQ